MRKTKQLKTLIKSHELESILEAHNGISAKIVEEAGFKGIWASGLAISSSLGVRDNNELSWTQVLEICDYINDAVDIPVLLDGDTGYGNSVNVFRTVRGYADAGAAGVMIEDQKWPKKCGHTKGKDVVDLDEANSRIKAAVDAREYGNTDILIMARTDAIATRGLDDAIKRMQIFSELGVDILFIEAIKSKEDMKRVIKEVPGHHMVNLIEDGDTPLLDMNELENIGYKIAVMPLTLMSASVKTMQECLKNIKNKTYNKDCFFK